MTLIPYTAAEGSANSYYMNVCDLNGSSGTSMQLYIRGLANSGAAQASLASVVMATTLLGVSGDVYSNYSDERLKTRVSGLTDALEKVNSLSGFLYYPNEEAISSGIASKKELRVGVSAQEVANVLPEAVAPSPANNEYLTVSYEKLVPLLIEAIKELNVKVDGIINSGRV
jgi:hypothetical protein